MRGQWFATGGRDLVACFTGGGAGGLWRVGRVGQERGARGDAVRRLGFETCFLSATSPEQQKWLPRSRIPPSLRPSGSTTSSARDAASPSSSSRLASASKSASASRAAVNSPQPTPQISASYPPTHHFQQVLSLCERHGTRWGLLPAPGGYAQTLDCAIRPLDMLALPCPSTVRTFSKVMLRDRGM